MRIHLIFSDLKHSFTSNEIERANVATYVRQLCDLVNRVNSEDRVSRFKAVASGNCKYKFPTAKSYRIFVTLDDGTERVLLDMTGKHAFIYGGKSLLNADALSFVLEEQINALFEDGQTLLSVGVPLTKTSAQMVEDVRSEKAERTRKALEKREELALNEG